MIKRTIKIIDTEIFYSIGYRILVNVSLLILMIFLQFKDISYKISSNYFVIIWISITSYFSFKLFLKGNRAFLMELSKFSSLRLYSLLWLVMIVINLHWYLFLILQMLLNLDATLGNALLISTVQFVLAISIGMFCSCFWRKNIGLVLIGILAIYNFVACSPYIYDGASHSFFISELLFSVNDINKTNLAFLTVYILFFVGLGYRLLKGNMRFRIWKNIALIGVFMIVWCSIFVIEKNSYQNIQQKEFCKTQEDNNTIYFRGISEKKAKEIGNIFDLFEKEYDIIGEDVISENEIYRIDKKFLPSILWSFQEEKPKILNVENNQISLNLLSKSMYNFEQPDLLRSFMEEINVEITNSIEECNNNCKYTLHLISGYNMCMLSNVAKELNTESGQTVYSYYKKYNEDFLEMPTTEFNFVKKIAMYIYRDHSEYAAPVYKYMANNRPNNDKEFLDELKEGFKNIYYDKEIQKVINELKY